MPTPEGGVTVRPDPIALATEQGEERAEAERDYVDGQIAVLSARLDAMDRATEVLHETVTRTPTEIQLAIGHIRELVFEHLAGIERLDTVREEHRLELKADAEKALSTAREADQKAVAAALAAAEKARDQQTIASQLATNKAETSFIDSLAKLTDTFTLAISNVTTSLNEVKDRLTTIEQRQFQREENRTTQRLDIGTVLGFLGFVVALTVGIAVVLR